MSNTTHQADKLRSALSASLFVAAYGGAQNVGKRTQRKVLDPYEDFREIDATKEAAELIISVHTALLKALPPQEIEQILKDRDARLSSVLSP